MCPAVPKVALVPGCLRFAPRGSTRAGCGRSLPRSNGTRLFYEVSGAGEPVVLIHGGQLDSRMWDTEFALLAREFRVLRYDVRGFGGSARPEGHTFSNAEDLRALLDYVGFEKAHLVGLSLGGRIALDFAPLYPGRVLSLTLAGPGLAGFEFPEPEEDARTRDVPSIKATVEKLEKELRGARKTEIAAPDTWSTWRNPRNSPARSWDSCGD